MDDKVLFRKNKNITMPKNDFALKDREESPFVNPIWKLPFKGLNPREKDVDDFNDYVTYMNDQQKLWLADGLRRMKPDSIWLEKLVV
ncbi:hypothetical protein A8709_26750 [Paenibacillus pectinilyticus]|uniref:Uncharacterized protein n=1 Tax=Paenibacillus pectinilyticus TaxID=512399 RepID=A0A1C1A1T9_9BACL|nr:hypothetical protein [Paenibacillus pectinilyticus]OCT14410.1 hypothetical protein A8709_26750 [Paenibacillus pectinilyticus]